MIRVCRHLLVVGCLGLWSLGLTTPAALAQLRIVSYNTANGSFTGNQTTPRSGMDIVLEAIGNESINGIAKPIDALVLQEQASLGVSTQGFVDILNDIYGAGTYARGNVLNGPSFSTIHQTLVYNTNTLQLISEQAFGSPIGGLNQAERQPIRYEMRPVGYDSSSDFYIYNSHYKAGTSSDNRDQRTAEAQLIRANADALGDGTNIIYAGDFNIRSSNETSYQTLLASGNGEAFDPIDRPGSWNNNSNFSDVHTQSPHDGSAGLVGGGIDDRFDFQLVSNELLDNEGLSYIPNSYRAFGNNGTTFNSSVNAGSNTYPLTNAQLDALAGVSDHLPVVADYQLPAVLSAQLDTLPSSIPLGGNVNVDVLVGNVANVVAALGADELDYSVTVTGDLIGSATGTDFALGGFNSHPIGLDTSVAGSRSGTVTVTTTSQGALNSIVNIPVSFTVGGVGGGPMFGLIAKDDFDSTVNRTAFSQTPAAGAFSSPADGFQVFQSGVSSSIPFALVDDSFSVFVNDQQGIVDNSPDSPGHKSDAWFGVVDTENSDNPGGVATATWSFDISGANGLEVSIDMGAMGDFDSADSFLWTYSIDGEAAQDLFTSSIDEAGSSTYTLADGDMFTLDDPLLMTNAQNQTVQLTNDFQTLTSMLDGSGDVLTLEFTAISNGNDAASFNSEAYVFDNIVIEGFTGVGADFNGDGDIDGADLLVWQRGFGTGTTFAEGDGNGDGQVDATDLAIWQSEYAGGALSTQQSLATVPEPSGLLLSVGCLLIVASRKASR